MRRSDPKEESHLWSPSDQRNLVRNAVAFEKLS
jgi:hypothetical protein